MNWGLPQRFIKPLRFCPGTAPAVPSFKMRNFDTALKAIIAKAYENKAIFANQALESLTRSTNSRLKK